MSDATSKRAWLTPDTAPTATRCRRVRIPDSEEWIAAVSGALTPLIYSYNWELFGTLTPEQAAERAQTMVLEYFQDDCMIGSIVSYATIDPPNGCIECDGGTYNRVDYPMLYAALDPVFIVDADTFTTPDLRGCTVIGAGTNVDSGTAYAMNERGGEEEHELIETELPAHTHTTQPHTHTANPHSHGVSAAAPTAIAIGPGLPAPSALPLPTTTAPAAVVLLDTVVTVDSTGSDVPHNNMQPFVALKYAMVAR